MSYHQKEIQKTQEKESRLIELLNAKANKMADGYLSKEKHTQLSYLKEDDRNYYVSVSKGILLDKLLAWLGSV